MRLPKKLRLERARIIRSVERECRQIDQYFTDAAYCRDHNPYPKKIDFDPDGTLAAYRKGLDSWLVEAVLTDGELPELPPPPK